MQTPPGYLSKTSATVPRFNSFLIKYAIFTGNTAAVNSSLGIDKNLNGHTTWILSWNVKDQILTNFHVISTYFLNVFLLIEKWSMVKNPRYFHILFAV